MTEPTPDPVCIEQGCTSPAATERPITPPMWSSSYATTTRHPLSSCAMR